MGQTINKTQIIPFISATKTGAMDWVRIRKTGQFSLGTNPETEEYDFIDQKEKSTVIKSYAPSVDLSIVMQKGEKDYNLLFPIFFDLPTGGDAERPALIIFSQEAGVIKERHTVKVHDDTTDPNNENPDLMIDKVDNDGNVVTEEVETAVYYAWSGNALLTPNTLDSVAATIDVSVNFTGIKKGGIKIIDKKPVFIEGEWSEDAAGKKTLIEAAHDGTSLGDL